jgi:hypothetical protein
MDSGLYEGEGPILTPEEYQRLQTGIWAEQRADADLEAEADDEPDGTGPEPDAPEPPELQDAADSDAWFDDETPSDPFASERRSGLPHFSDLPYSARPFVRYWIDRDFQVHKMDRRDDLQSKRCDAIAGAIALHLQKSICRLLEPGDWCQIPHIDRDRSLLELVKAADPQQWESDLSKVSELARKLATIKDFAIMLPNGDVLAVQAFIDGAREGKRATRAAALRVAADKPPKLAGDDWEDADWKGVNHNEAKAKADARRRAKQEQEE